METTPQPYDGKKVKLLLHSEDGCIPFLTPHLLENYFPVSSPWIQDHLVVGMAVKDTCITPLFQRKGNVGDNGKHESENGNKATLSNKEKKRKKRKLMEGDGTSTSRVGEESDGTPKRQRIDGGGIRTTQGTEEQLNSVTTHDQTKDNKKNNNITKPTGYSFSHQTHDILLGYHSMTVPTFDLVDDATKFVKSKCKNDAKQKTKKMNANNGNAAKNNLQQTAPLPPIPTTNNHVTLCTPHGMQKLDVETYIKIVMDRSGHSKSIVGLYDQAHMDDKKKRKINCMERTKSWMEKLMEDNKEGDTTATEKRNIWSPFICNVIAREESNEENVTVDKGSTTHFAIPFDEQLQSVLGQQEHIVGIAMVGLHHIPSRSGRNKLLQQCSESLQSIPSLDVAVLVTKNLKQILDATKFGVSMFGCDLPSQWARSGKSLALSIERSRDSSRSNVAIDLTLDEDGCIDLSSDKYSRDKRPLSLGCQCLSCRDTTYTRAYIHHLIKANELLGNILLFGHNLYQMLLLCKEFSIAHSNGTIDQYCEFIENQLS